MSDGATMSAPARACDTAARASRSSELSLSTSPSMMIPQCPWSVYSHRQTSVMTMMSGAARLNARTASCTMPSAAYASVPSASFEAGSPNSKHRRDAQRLQVVGLPRDLVERDPVLPRHRLDLLAHAGAVRNEQRIDEVLGREPRLGD